MAETCTTPPCEEKPWFKGKFALRTGVVLIAEVGLVSLVAISVLLTIVTVRAFKKHRRQRAGRARAEDEPLQPVSILFICAMLSELFQALGNIVSVRWAFKGAASSGSLCTAQAVLKQVGNDGVALFTLFIALVTFLQIRYPWTLKRQRGRRLAWAIIAFVVLFETLMIAIPATTIKDPPYYGPTGPWCWITNDSKKNRIMEIASEYAWFWLASFVCFVCYGYIIVKFLRESHKFNDRTLLNDAVTMSWYPIAYFIEIFPQSVTRILALYANKHVPPGWTIFTSLLFASSGWVNVLLWTLTGRRFGFSSSAAATVSEAASMASSPSGGGLKDWRSRHQSLIHRHQQTTSGSGNGLLTAFPPPDAVHERNGSLSPLPYEAVSPSSPGPYAVPSPYVYEDDQRAHNIKYNPYSGA